LFVILIYNDFAAKLNILSEYLHLLFTFSSFFFLEICFFCNFVPKYKSIIYAYV